MKTIAMAVLEGTAYILLQRITMIFEIGVLINSIKFSIEVSRLSEAELLQARKRKPRC